MCGACGTGPATPPWEIAAHGGDMRAHRNRAAQASALTGGRLRVRPAGPCGYDVSTRTGKQWVVSDVDHLVLVLREHGGPTVLAAAATAVAEAVAKVGCSVAGGAAEHGAAETARGRDHHLTPEQEQVRALAPVAWALVETASRQPACG